MLRKRHMRLDLPMAQRIRDTNQVLRGYIFCQISKNHTLFVLSLSITVLFLFCFRHQFSGMMV